MSLINQVLQDLQQRQAPGVGNAHAALRDVNVTPRQGVRTTVPPWLLWSAIVVLASVSGALLWQRGQARAVPSIPHAATTPIAAPRPMSPAVAASVTPPSEAVPVSAAPVAMAPPDAPAVPATTVVAAPPAPAAAVPQFVPPAPPPATVVKTPRPLDPEQQAALAYQDAMRLLRSGRPSAAEPRLRAALASSAAYRPARAALAALLVNAGRLAEARTLLAQGLELAPTHAPFARLYARLLIDQGDLAGARTVLERAAPQPMADPEYHALLAALYQRTGQYALAAQTYRGALQAQPRNGVWWMGLGIALEGDGDVAGALQAYQRARQSGTLTAEVLHYTEQRIAALQTSNGSHQ